MHPSPAEKLYKITRANERPRIACDPVAARSGETPEPGAWDPDRAALNAAQDDCLVAIDDKKPIPVGKLKQLPPWRAVMIARIGKFSRIELERGTVASWSPKASRSVRRPT